MVEPWRPQVDPWEEREKKEKKVRERNEAKGDECDISEWKTAAVEGTRKDRSCGDRGVEEKLLRSVTKYGKRLGTFWL